MRFHHLLIVLAVSLATSPASAKLTRLEIEKREVVADGQSFGSAGAYEKLTGRAWFEIDPAHPRNRTITDIKSAPVNDKGLVEFSADMVILKPVHMENASGSLFFEVNNSGDKLVFETLQDTAAGTNGNDPSKPEDFGNGFLMRRGYVLAWVGWGADIEPGNHRLTVDFPVAMNPLTSRGRCVMAPDGRLSGRHERRSAGHGIHHHRIF